MRPKIAGFVKTDHFQYRQWQRGLSDYELSKILNLINCEDQSYMLVIGKNRLAKFKISFSRELFIKIKNKVLITFFYGKLEFQMRKNNQEKYHLIN
jgi:hypothetical protein